MKAIIFGTSLSGKTTIVRLLREDTHFNVSEIDEELTRLNDGVFPADAEKKHNVLAPEVIKQVLGQDNIIFFCNTDYFSDQDIVNAKELGFKIVQFDISLEELEKRNRPRMENEGYEDMSPWLKGMVAYQDRIFRSGFVDKRVDVTQSPSEVVQDLLNYLSNTMKAIICTKYGGPEVLQIQDIPKPEPKDNEILVKIIATTVNSGDVRVRSLGVEGVMKVMMLLALGFTKPRKPILGTVFAGVVESVGKNVSAFKENDKVFGMTGFKFGCYAEYIAVREKSNVITMPDNATFEDAASWVFGGQTAIHFLEKAKISEMSEPKVLIIGATGAVGTAAIQIAKHYNAQITAVCSSAGADLVRSLGVSDIVLYDQEDFTKLTQKFDIVFDAVGKTTKAQCSHLLGEKGIYKTVGGFEVASESKSQLEMLKKLFESGEYKSVIDKTFAMEDVVEAHRYVDTGRKKGNLVLRIGYVNIGE